MFKIILFLYLQRQTNKNCNHLIVNSRTLSGRRLKASSGASSATFVVSSSVLFPYFVHFPSVYIRFQFAPTCGILLYTLTHPHICTLCCCLCVCLVVCSVCVSFHSLFIFEKTFVPGIVVQGGGWNCHVNGLSSCSKLFLQRILSSS